jgi:hypothetical protein
VVQVDVDVIEKGDYIDNIRSLKGSALPIQSTKFLFTGHLTQTQSPSRRRKYFPPKHWEKHSRSSVEQNRP